VVVDAGVKKKQRGRPLLEVDGEVCSKNHLTGPTLLEMQASRKNSGEDHSWKWMEKFVQKTI
jgi:hypothetical protein